LACTSPASKNLAAPISFAKSATIFYRCRLRKDRLLPYVIFQRRTFKAFTLVGGPFRFLGRARLEPGALVLCRAWLFQFRRKTAGNCRNVANQRKGLVVVKRVAKIAVDIDHGLRILVADAGTIRLADGARADDNQKFGFRHSKISADRSFRAADVHVLRVRVRQYSRRAR
jgi:hypothetical protein